MSVQRVPWTDEQVATLRRLFDEGLSHSQIAKQIGFGCTRNASIGKAHRLGMRRKLASPPERVKARKAEPNRKPRQPACEPRTAAPRVRPAPAPPPPPERTSEPLEAPTTLTIRSGQCRWPVWGHGEGMRMCGAETPEGSPWCGGHVLIAWVPRTSSAERQAAFHARRVELGEVKAPRKDGLLWSVDE